MSGFREGSGSVCLDDWLEGLPKKGVKTLSVNKRNILAAATALLQLIIIDHGEKLEYYGRWFLQVELLQHIQTHLRILLIISVNGFGSGEYVKKKLGMP